MDLTPLGVALATVMLAPSVLLLARPPVDGPLPDVGGRLFVALERTGQAGCLTAVAAWSPGLADARPGGLAFAAVACVLGYYALWGRYLLVGRRVRALVAPWWVVPVPMAVLPVAVFTLTAASSRSLWLAGASVLLALGHIPVSWRAAAALQARRS